MPYFIWGFVFPVLFCSSVVFCASEHNQSNPSEITSVKSEINDADFSVFNKYINDNGEEFKLDNGKTITIKKSATHPNNEIIATYETSKDKVVIFKIKNIDNYAKVLSVIDEKGQEVGSD